MLRQKPDMMEPASDPNYWHREMTEAASQVRSWQMNFQNADAEYVDYCIFQLRAAEERLAMVFREARRIKGISPSRLPAASVQAALVERSAAQTPGA